MARTDGSTAGRLGHLARRHRLDPDAVESMTTLLRMVVDDPLAPTSVRDPGKVLDDHLADSLVALGLPELLNAVRIADLGSGAGFPGLPLAIALPAASFTLVESNARKCAFIARAAAACGTANVQIANARAESWPEGLARFDVVTARALAPLNVVAEYAAPLLGVGGVLVVWRGRRDAEAEAEAARAAAALGLEPREPQPVSPYRGAQHRHLHLMIKTGETPPGFPRRPGIAAKRPLGASPPSDRAHR
jgi:16S rRNA (guanine527-N7)-methyltransferase